MNNTPSTLEQIENMPLPTEVREQTMDLARRLSEEQRSELCEELKTKLLAHENIVLQEQKKLLKKFEEEITVQKKELRSVQHEAEGEEHAEEIRTAETDLSQSA